MPAQVSIFSAVPVPQVLSGWSVCRLLLAAIAAQLFWMATRFWQSSTRSLLAPAVVGLAVVSTKVPSEQLEEASAVIAVLDCVPVFWQPMGSYVPPVGYPWSVTPVRRAVGKAPDR